MKTPISVKLPFSDPIEFQMDFDGDCLADQATVHFLNKYGGMCEPEVCHLMARAVRPGDFVVDVGANIGFFTLLLAKLVGEKGWVVSFEPSPQNIHKLEDNIALNRFEQVQQVRFPLWSSQTEVELWMARDGGMASLGRSAWSMGQATLSATTLEVMFPKPPFPRLIKMDAEGSEYNILLGAGRMLRPASIPFIVCEINEEALKRLGRSGTELRAYMNERGYDLFMLHGDGNLPSLLPQGTRLTSNAPNLNVLFSTLCSVSEAWPELTVQYVPE